MDMGEWTDYNQFHGFDESYVYRHILFYRLELNVQLLPCFFHIVDIKYKRKDSDHKEHGCRVSDMLHTQEHHNFFTRCFFTETTY